MEESIKPNKGLTNENDNASDLYDSEPERETIKVLEAFSKEIELENKDVDCNLKNSCYIAKNKMGQCPCELYR